MKAILYVRVSTEEQTHGYSLEGQREKCLKKAEEMGATDSVVFEDAGVSGEVLNRPALMDAISLLSADKGYKLFICTDPDRLSRQLGNLIAFTEQIEKHAQLVFTDFTRENTAEGQLFYSIRGAVAEFEKEMIKRRTVAGKIRKARAGGWTHWPGIYGYVYTDGVVTVNETQSDVIRLIFRLGAEMGVRQVADRLGLLGLTSPRAEKIVWSATTIKRIIQNEAYYTGITHIRTTDSSGVHLNKYKADEDKLRRKMRPTEEWVAMELPPIVDEEVWKAANRRLTNARRKAETQETPRYLLSGLLRCGHCGKTWHGYSTEAMLKDGPKRRKYYVCTYRIPGPPKGTGLEKCETGYVQCAGFDAFVWETVRGWLADDSAMDEFEARQTHRGAENPAMREFEMLEERVTQLGREEDALIERLSKEQNPRLRQKIGEQLDKVAADLDAVQRIASEAKKASNEIAVAEVDKRLVWAAREKYGKPENMSAQQQYDAIHELIREVIVSKTEKREYRLKIVPF